MNFLCEKDDNPQFSRCMEAIDCKVFLPVKTFLLVQKKNYEMHGFPPDYISLEDPKVNIQMNYEMRVEEHSNPLVVFMHQMIPHHENAVNMARWGGRLSDY